MPLIEQASLQNAHMIALCGAGMPPEEEVDFVLDRPFLFLVTARDGSILFAGTVCNI